MLADVLGLGLGLPVGLELGLLDGLVPLGLAVGGVELLAEAEGLADVLWLPDAVGLGSAGAGELADADGLADAEELADGEELADAEELADGEGMADGEELADALPVTLAMKLALALGLLRTASSEMADFGRLAQAPAAAAEPPARRGAEVAASTLELDDSSTNPEIALSASDRASCVFTGTTSPSLTSPLELEPS